MAELTVVHWGGTGNTEAVASLVADGARKAGADVSICISAEPTPELVDEFEHIAFGCPSMGAEQLGESEFELILDSVKERLSSKKVALFGSYGWGNGGWMRIWDSDLQGAGISMVGTVIANKAPDDEAAKNRKDLDKALANA